MAEKSVETTEMLAFSASMVATRKFTVEVRINEAHIGDGKPSSSRLASTGQSGPDKSPRRGPETTNGVQVFPLTP